MIKVLNAHLLDAFRLDLDFNDHTQGVFDADALCWPNGLEFSPAEVHELVGLHMT